VQEKDCLIDDLQGQIHSLSRANDLKSEEIRTLIEKMEAYKAQRDQEALKMRRRLQQAEEDIKVLIVE